MINTIIGRNISILYRHKNLDGDIRLKKYRLNKIRAEVLLFLMVNNGATQTKINRFFLFNKASITRIIVKLERTGFVKRETDKKDKREKSVFLTKKANDILPEIKEAFLTFEKRMLRNIPPENQNLVRLILAQMVENIIGEE